MSALEELQELYNADPDTERVSLRGKELAHIDAEMAYLQLHFANIRHLDLSENALEALPVDFGQLLPKLVALDVTKNRFRSVADLGDVLQKCTSLKSLSVTLKSATEERLLLVMLPKLRILNGTPLSSPASPPPPPPLASQSEDLESPVKAAYALSTVLLSPSTASNSSGGEGDNRTASLNHADLSPPTPRSPSIASPQDKRTLRLQFANLKLERQAVDNERQRSAASDALVRRKRSTAATAAAPQPGSAAAAVPRSKSSSVRPTEKPATISDDKTDWHKLLKSQESASRGDKEPAQETLGKAAKAPAAASTTTDSFLSQLKTVVKTFHQCDARNKQRDSSSSGSVANQQLMVYEQLDRHVDLLASQLSRQERDASSRIPNPGSEPMDSDVARMKKSLAVLQTRWNLLEVCGMYGVERASGVDGTLGKAFETLLQMQKEVLVALQTQQAAIASKAQLAAKAQQHSSGSVAKSESQHSEQQMRVLLEVAESLESDLEAAQTRLQQEKAQRELLEQENWSLKRENEAFRKKPRDSGTKSSSSSPQAIIASIRMQTSPLISQRSPQRKSNNNTQPRTARTEASALEPTAEPVAAIATAAPQQPMRIRNLTLKQLVDLIQCITASKLKHDARSFEVGAPRETVEQHMYTYLNQRFGLKALTIEYASAIWKGCEAFAKQENDAALFLALLKNHVDEGFLGIKKKLKQALVDLLRAYFQAKFPLKQELPIATLVQNRTQSLIYEDEWRELLTYLYDPQDSSMLLRLVKQKAETLQRGAGRQQRQKSLRAKASAPPVASAATSLPFAVFEQLLFDYQLQGRIKLLEDFRRAFESYDSERVGIVDHESFGSIVHRIAPKKSAATIEKLLETLDPFQHDMVTFSDAVSGLMGDIRSKRPSPAKPSSAMTIGATTKYTPASHLKAKS